MTDRRIIKTGKEWMDKGHPTIDSFIKIITDFKIIPDDEFAKVTLFSFKGEKVNAKRINEQLCMNQKQLSKYISVPYQNVKRAFSRTNLQEGKHYFRIGVQNVPHIYLTLLGCLLLTEGIIKAFTEALKQTEQKIKPINEESKRCFI